MNEPHSFVFSYLLLVFSHTLIPYLDVITSQVSENADFDGRSVALRREFRAHLKALAPHVLNVFFSHLLTTQCIKPI